MRRVLKATGIVLAVMAAAALVLAVLAKAIITPARVREAVLPLAESSLHRQVEVGDIDISLFSGIVLKDLRIHEPDSRETFAGVGRVLLRYRLWPLLFKRVLVDEVRFDSPRIRIVRLADGAFNFSDLLQKKEEAGQTATGKDHTGRSIDLLISEAALSQGSIEFIDQYQAGRKPLLVKIEPLAAHARGLSFNHPFPFSLEAAANGNSLALTGDFDPQAQAVTAQIDLKIGEESVAIALNARNLSSQLVNISHTITAKRLTLDPLLAAGGAPQEGTATEARPAGGDDKSAEEEPGPLALPLAVDGTVQIERAICRGLEISGLDLRYRLENNILTIDRLTGATAGGTFNKTATIDLGKKGFVYNTDIQLQKVEAAELVKVFQPEQQGSVSGTTDLDLALRGSGVSSARIRKNLSGNGKVLVTNGRVSGPGLAQGLAEFLGNERLRELTFSSLKGDLTLADGRINIDGNVDGSEVRMAPRGSVGLDQTLDLALDTRLSPAIAGGVSSRMHLPPFFTDAEGWTRVPLKVSGTAAAPHFALDTALIKEGASQTIQQKLEETLRGKQAPQTSPPSGTVSSPPPATPPAGKDLKDTLRGIFGR